MIIGHQEDLTSSLDPNLSIQQLSRALIDRDQTVARKIADSFFSRYLKQQTPGGPFAGAAGSRISERGPVPLRRTVAGAVGNFRIRGAVRFSDDLQLLRPPAHSTGTALRHSFLP